jgi:hypothetical protein
MPASPKIGLALIAVVLLGCGRPHPPAQITLDCDGPVTGQDAWIDTYALDLRQKQYCETSCGAIQALDGPRVTIDLYGDHVHTTVIDLSSGKIAAWQRVSDTPGNWRPIQGRCRQVGKSRYVRYE